MDVSVPSMYEVDLHADRAIKREASISANELLMPEASVRAERGELVAQGHKVDPEAAMAARLDVSLNAMR